MRNKPMAFDLRRPCPKCPFRLDCLRGWLGDKRISQIVRDLVDQEMTFACHETLSQKTDQHCVGALLFVENVAPPFGHRLQQIAQRLGLYFPEKLDREAAAIFTSREDLIAHHSWRGASS